MGTFVNTRYNPRSAVEAALNAANGMVAPPQPGGGPINNEELKVNNEQVPVVASTPQPVQEAWPSDMARAEAKRAGKIWAPATGAAPSGPNDYLADWGHWSLGDVVYGHRGDDGVMDDTMRRSDIPVHQLVSDYARYAQANGQIPDYVSMIQTLNAGDPRLSSDEQSQEAKREKRRERWERLTNLLAHLGNFYGTTQGAPSAPLESGIELSKRQRQLRDLTFQQRQSVANQYLQAYARRAQEQRLADAAKAQEENREQMWKWRQQQEERLAAKQEFEERKLNWRKEYEAGRLDVVKEQNRIREMVAKGQISHYEAQDALNKLKAFATKTTTTEETDPLTGEKKTKTATVTTTPAGSTPSKAYQPKKTLTYKPKK